MLGAGRVNKVAGWCVELHWKETGTGIFLWMLENVKNIFSTEHLGEATVDSSV